MSKIFESPDHGLTIYSREAGSYDRKLIHEHDPRTSDGRTLHEHIMESKLWGDIHRAAKTNPALQKALEQCIIIYHLSNPPKEDIPYHPV